MKPILRRLRRDLSGLDLLAASPARPSPARGRRFLPAAFEPLEPRRLLSATPGPTSLIRPADANGNTPTASISAPDVTSASVAAEQINITFNDSSGIDRTSITADNITVVNQSTGASLAVTGATLSPADGSAATDVATYTVAAPDAGGKFASDDNGTYVVTLRLNQVYDPTGQEAPQTSGSFMIDIAPAGATAPAATIAAPAPITTAAPSVHITVTYAVTTGAGNQINASTITPDNLLVTGPNGALTVNGVTVAPSAGNAATLVATYTIAAPNGAFTNANNGPHPVTLNPAHPVQDTNGLSAVAKPASVSFDIALPTALAAAINMPLAVGSAQPTEAVTVAYSDASGIDLSSLTLANLLVTKQGVANPTPLTVTGVSLTPDTGTPTQVTATYTIAAPAGAFSLTDNGTYAVALQANQARDVNGVFAAPVSSSFAVNVPGTVALTPGLSRLKLPAAVAAGAALRLAVPVTITNHGDITSAGAAAFALYASPTPALDGATRLASTTARVALKPGKSRTVNLRLSGFPASLPAGAYYVIAQVIDAAGNSAVAASASTVAVAPPFIDLTGSLLPVPSVLRAGKRTSLAVTVTNAGNVAAAGSLQVQFLARPAGTAGSADVPLGTPAVRIKLAPGATKRLRLPVVVSPTLSAGTSYTLVAVLDPANLFNDSNRTDNTLAGTYIFSVG